MGAGSLTGNREPKLRLLEGADGLDGEAVALIIQTVDRADNPAVEPVTITYRVDLTPPVLTASEMVTGVPPGWAQAIASGRVADGLSVSLYAHVGSPEGVDSRSKARLSGDDWFYGPAWTGPGVYRLWLQAVDGGGNTAEVGPFTISVGLAPRSYLPIVTRQLSTPREDGACGFCHGTISIRQGQSPLPVTLGSFRGRATTVRR